MSWDEEKVHEGKRDFSFAFFVCLFVFNNSDRYEMLDIKDILRCVFFLIVGTSNFTYAFYLNFAFYFYFEILLDFRKLTRIVQKVSIYPPCSFI